MKVLKEKIRKNFWEIVDWLILLTCTFSSFFFVIGVWENFTKKTSNFTMDIKPVEEQPTISFCFHEELPLDIYFHFDVYYYKAKTLPYKSIQLQEGNNSSPSFGNEVITLRRSYKIGCYSISSDNADYEPGYTRYIKIVIRDWWITSYSILDIVLYHNVKFVFTKNNDHYGASNGLVTNGKPFEVSFAPQWMGYIVIQPEETKFLKDKINCGEENFWELFAEALPSLVHQECNVDTCIEIHDNLHHDS